MAADGSIIIDTKINSDGITAGAKDIQDGVDRMALALKNANKEILKFIDDYEKGLNQSTASTNEFRKQIESLKKQLKSMESKGLYFGDEDYDNTYLQLQKVQQALKDYKKELVSPTPDAMSFDSSSLEGQIERLSNKLVKLREQGKGFGDETFDSAYKSLIKVQEELKEYKKNLTKKEEPIQLPMVVDTSTMEGQINLLTVIDVLRDIISFLSAVFKGDWEGAWKSIVKIFKDIFGGVSGIAETIMGGIFDKFETFKERALGALRAVLDKINEVLFGYDDLEKAGKVKSAKGSFVSNVTSVIPRSSEVHLPRLASGTVIPPRAGEFAAILGDNKRETEVVSPISTMKQALKEALGDFGGIGGGDIHLTVNLEGKAIYDTVVKRNRMEKNRTGSNPLLA